MTDDSGNNNSITPNEPVRKDQDTPFNHFVIPPKNTETPKHPEEGVWPPNQNINLGSDRGCMSLCALI